MKCLWVWVVVVFAQPVRDKDYAAERKKLERRRQQIEVELRQTQELLLHTRKERHRSLTELSLLRRQINLREKLLQSLQQEMTLLDQDIYQLAQLSQSLERDLRRLYRNYIWTLYLLDKTQRQMNPWLWILSAESFRQAYERLFYFRAVSRFRQEQLQLIQRTHRFFLSRSASLRKSREEKNRLLLLYIEQAQALQRSQAEKKALFHQLRQQELSYKSQIHRARRELEQIQRKIDELIRAELEAARKATPTVAERRITGAFEQNKGNLPWPIASDQAVVTSPFGTVEDESGGFITNHGVYLAGPNNTEVRAIFGGRVTAVTTIPTQGKVVIIQHGTYRTVYAHLKEVFVQPGQNVSILTPIGRISSENGEPCQLYFLIYKGKTPVNPLEWVASR
ncbi:MAG: peptidoglycan DD-metalloendopeptidase family protein [Bacteroidia bacterium]|nr:peptidoglycan DD-metalloendopeptidase family protein [Bacteroidia bacterium]MDW8235361.1 peptidoglycan DD-metalloendopeptidase family protein [Bacteroidia bacterium]